MRIQFKLNGQKEWRPCIYPWRKTMANEAAKEWSPVLETMAGQGSRIRCQTMVRASPAGGLLAETRRGPKKTCSDLQRCNNPANIKNNSVEIGRNA
jgi:hypothetical protein